MDPNLFNSDPDPGATFASSDTDPTGHKKLRKKKNSGTVSLAEGRGLEVMLSGMLAAAPSPNKTAQLITGG